MICKTVWFFIGIFYGSIGISIYWLGFFVIPALWLSVTGCVVCCSNLSTKSNSLILISEEDWIFYFVSCFQFQLIWDYLEPQLTLHTTFPLQFLILATSVFLTILFSNHTLPFIDMQESLHIFYVCKSSDEFLDNLLLELLQLLTVSCNHVTYAFQNESTLYICVNVKELLARNRRDVWSLSDCNGTRTHNHLVCKRTLNHLAKLTKWLSWVANTYLYGAFDRIFLSCHIRVYWG